MVLQYEPRGVTKVLESVPWLSRWWIDLLLIASHGKPFQILTQTTFCCCLSGIGTLRWSVPIPEDTPTTPKQIGLSSTNASTTVSMQCYQSFPVVVLRSPHQSPRCGLSRFWSAQSITIPVSVWSASTSPAH